MELYFDYPKEPIGGGNPYYRCCSCKRSDPEINGHLEGYYDFCKWRKRKEQEMASEKMTREGFCVGNGSNGSGCGFRGLKAGDVCPKCGGMILDDETETEAKALAEVWKQQDRDRGRTA